MSELPAIVSGLVVRPGDTLIIGVTTPMTDEEIDHMAKVVDERMPGLKVAIVDHVNALAAYRPDPEPAPTIVECSNAGCEHFREPVEIRLRRWGSAVERLSPFCACGWAMAVPTGSEAL